jgi:hypothetical protein
LALTFLGRCPKDGDDFLQHIVLVTGNEIWVSFMNVETKEQSKQGTYIHQKSLIVQTNAVYQKAEGHAVA